MTSEADAVSGSVTAELATGKTAKETYVVGQMDALDASAGLFGELQHGAPAETPEQPVSAYLSRTPHAGENLCDH